MKQLFQLEKKTDYLGQTKYFIWYKGSSDIFRDLHGSFETQEEAEEEFDKLIKQYRNPTTEIIKQTEI